jgi:hypothetical protein
MVWTLATAACLGKRWAMTLGTAANATTPNCAVDITPIMRRFMASKAGRCSGVGVSTSLVPEHRVGSNVVATLALRSSLTTACFLILTASGACGGAGRAPPIAPQPEQAHRTEGARGLVRTVPQNGMPSRETQAAPGAEGRDGCATGGVLCPASKSYCCRILGADGEFGGRSECVASYDDCTSMEFACTHENHRCPDTQGVVAIGCADDDPKRQLVKSNGEDAFDCADGSTCRCEFRFLHNQAYHDEAPP